jgi:hypothetical protein
MNLRVVYVRKYCDDEFTSSICEEVLWWWIMFHLSSDHSPVLITLTAHVLNQENQPSSSNRHTNWDDFRHLINQRLTLNVPLKLKKTLKQQSSSWTVQNSGRIGTQHQNIQTHSRHVTALYQLNKKSKKKEDSVEVGTDCEHQRAKDYLTQQHRNSRNSSITTKIIASKHSCKVLHQQNPLTIPCGRRLRK